MKKFRFMFETLLKYHKSKENLAKSAFLLARQKLVIEEQRFQKFIARTMTDYENTFNGTRTGVIRIDETSTVRLPTQKLVDDIVASKHRIHDIKLEIEEKRKDLKKITQTRKLFSRIKEKQWQQYQFDMNIMELRENDDLEQNRFNMKIVNSC